MEPTLQIVHLDDGYTTLSKDGYHIIISPSLQIIYAGRYADTPKPIFDILVSLERVYTFNTTFSDEDNQYADHVLRLTRENIVLTETLTNKEALIEQLVEAIKSNERIIQDQQAQLEKQKRIINNSVKTMREIIDGSEALQNHFSAMLNSHSLN